MLEIALVLTEYDPVYEEIAFRFLEHFVWITYAMDRIGTNHDEMWDTEDGFFYDLLHFPNGDAVRLKVRSLVWLLPLCASSVFEPGAMAKHPRIQGLIALFKKRHPELIKHIAPADDSFIGYKGRRLLSVCNKRKIESILTYMLDENEFLSPFGIRSLPGTTSTIPSFSTYRVRNTKFNTSRPNLTQECLEAIPTGAGPSGCQ
jgi:hypothetical protein